MVRNLNLNLTTVTLRVIGSLGCPAVMKNQCSLGRAVKMEVAKPIDPSLINV
jgi:hypothetical protein